MPDLGQMLGTLLASLAHARRIADEETAAIAEYYRRNPLLEGMSLPRVRVPELVLELPLLIEAHEEGEPSEVQEPAHIREQVGAELLQAAGRMKFPLTAAFRSRFDQQLRLEMEKLSSSEKLERGMPREQVVRAVDTAFSQTLAQDKGRKPTLEQQRLISSDLRLKAGSVALKSPGVPSRISASIVTAEVKEKADAGNVVRLRLVLREEGLEWSVSENADGTTTRKLTPE